MLRLKELRKKNKMSQQQLAERLGVTQATLSGWENEKYEIDHTSLLKCSDIFQVSIDYLLGNTIEPEELQIARKKTQELHASFPSITIEMIEQQTGTNYGTFRTWYQGLGDYFNDKLYLIADLYHVSVDHLLGREERAASLDEQLEGLDFALYGEIKELTDEQKQDILDYARFKKAQWEKEKNGNK